MFLKGSRDVIEVVGWFVEQENLQATRITKEQSACKQNSRKENT